MEETEAGAKTFVDVERWVAHRQRQMQLSLRARIIDRVASMLVPRSRFLLLRKPNEEDKPYAVPKWILRTSMQSWDTFFTIEIAAEDEQIVLKLNSIISPSGVFCNELESEPGVGLYWASNMPDAPKDSLQFLAARAMAAAWDQYDEATQQLICDTVTL
jgi:hypothetical protein